MTSNCKSGKIGYPSAKKARLAATAVAAKGHAGLFPYKCRHCGAWHIGHPLPELLDEPAT